jgi:eukaryotic-like serine/threonine-protein kinase
LLIARRCAVVLAVVTSTLALPGIARADWSQFHASQTRSGVVSTETVLTALTAPSIHELWGAPTDPTTEGINSSPAVAGGLAYIGSDDGSLWAFDASTGAPVWRDPVGAQVRTSPAVADGRVFFGSAAGVVYADDALTGARLWSYVTGGNVTAPPLVVGTTVYICPRSGSFVALDVATGAMLWKANVWGMWGGAAYAKGVVYVGSEQSKVFAFDALTGAPVWSTGLGARVRSTPSVADGRVFVGTDAGNVVSLAADTGKVLWSQPGSPPSTNAVIRSSPAVAGGRVFVATAETTPMDGDAVAFDEKTGAVDWRADYIADYSTSSPAVANGVVYVGSYDTRLYAIKAGSGKLLWAPAWGTQNMDRGFNSSPAIANGRVYIGCRDGSLYAFGIG